MKDIDPEEFREILEGLPEEVKDYLRQVADRSASEEEFLRNIFVGDCPHCGSKNTNDCSDLYVVEDPTLGLCGDCGHLWCLECGGKIRGDISSPEDLVCGHWEICENCELIDEESGLCEVPPWECERIVRWLEENDLAEIDYTDHCANICAWCSKPIPENEEVYGLGVKIKGGVDLKSNEGRIIPWFLPSINRSLPATVTAANSPAKKAGNDLMFMTCSKKCALALRAALQKDREIFEKINMN